MESATSTLQNASLTSVDEMTALCVDIKQSRRQLAESIDHRPVLDLGRYGSEGARARGGDGTTPVRPGLAPRDAIGGEVLAYEGAGIDAATPVTPPFLPSKTDQPKIIAPKSPKPRFDGLVPFPHERTSFL